MANLVCYDTDGSILSHYTQWDVNQKLIIKGADTSSAPDFHFINAFLDDTIVVESVVNGNSLTANVPDELLQYSVPVIVHIHYIPGTTEYTVRIPVMPRQKPDGYVYTDTESGGNIIGGLSIADNLTTNNPKMVLSAAQGVVIKSEIDSIKDTKAERDWVTSEIDKAIEEIGEIVSVADNLDTNDPKLALSAAQGVVIKERLDNIDQSIDNLITSDEMTSAISSALENRATYDEVDASISEAVSDKVTVSEMNSTIDTKIGEALSNFENDGSGEGVLIANNLSTDNPSMALSATQGVVLNGRLTSIEESIKEKVTSEEVDAAIESALDGFEGGAGSDGYTPVRGVDYWTDDDIAEIKSYVDDAILGGEW